MQNHGFQNFENQDFSKIEEIMIFRKSKKSHFRKMWLHIFENPKILNFKKVSEIYPTLKCCNFFAIGSILKILDVPERSGSVLSHYCVCFPDPSGQPQARSPIRCRWVWVLRDLRRVWIRFPRILSLKWPESSHITSDISKMKDIHFKRFQYVFSTCLLRRMRYRTTRLRYRWLCTLKSRVFILLWLACYGNHVQT